MSLFAPKSSMNAADRLSRRRLILSDSLSLVTLFAITALLAVLTNYFYQSYASHQVVLANRWLGQTLGFGGRPAEAVAALSPAGSYRVAGRGPRGTALTPRLRRRARTW